MIFYYQVWHLVVGHKHFLNAVLAIFPFHTYTYRIAGPGHCERFEYTTRYCRSVYRWFRHYTDFFCCTCIRITVNIHIRLGNICGCRTPGIPYIVADIVYLIRLIHPIHRLDRYIQVWYPNAVSDAVISLIALCDSIVAICTDSHRYVIVITYVKCSIEWPDCIGMGFTR